jgi:hypothetical protein
MGMYTEIYVKISFKPETPQSVIDTIAAMMGEKEAPETLPDHELFTKGRWYFMLRCSSFYHMPMCG